MWGERVRNESEMCITPKSEERFIENIDRTVEGIGAGMLKDPIRKKSGPLKGVKRGPRGSYNMNKKGVGKDGK